MTILATLLLQWGPHHPHGPWGPMVPQGPMGPGNWAGTGTMPWGVGTGLGWWSLLLLLCVLLLVAVAVAVAAFALRAQTAAEDTDDPVEILRARYARGDIDDEEFEHRRTTLDGPTT